MKNWVEQFDLSCASKSQFGYFGSFFFIGAVLGGFIFPRLSDIYGRKKICIFSSLLHFISALVILFAQSENFTLIFLFLMGFASGGRVVVGYIWMFEHIPQKYLPMCTMAMFSIDSLAICWCSLYFQFISKDWRPFFAIPLFPMFLAIIIFCFQSESPKFYYSQGKFDQLREILT